FTLHNIRRETKLRRRTSVPITEEEQDIARYLTNNTTDFTLHNIRRETKLRRRTSVPITEEEQDIARYLTSTSIIKRPD
ncbi:unnamed protein product, partial [Rotaria sp. Silwood1]